MNQTELKGMDKAQLEEFAKSIGLKPFNGRQVFRWIYQDGVIDFASMTNLSKANREKLADIASISELETVQKLHSSDGSTKFLFKLRDGLKIESVLIPESRRVTLCISSQAGCPVKCKFCATGQIGFNRNLAAGEIVDQFLLAQRESSRRISNIVFMGMGEPTLNLENVLRACRILCDDHGPSFSQKRITISTVGIVHKMKDFASGAEKLGLAISIHSADEEKRKSIIPVASKNPLADIMSEAKRYTQLSKRRVSIEYLLLGGFNDSISDAKKLINIIYGIPCKINLMRYNPVAGLPFVRPKEDDVIAFRDYLYPRTYAVTIRESRGVDIKGACGQLAGNL